MNHPAGGLRSWVRDWPATLAPVCPTCRLALVEVPAASGDATGAAGPAVICPGCRQAMRIGPDGRHLDFSAFLAASETAAVRKVGLAYRFYALAYAPLALLNMLTVWRAGLGTLVRHYARALGGGEGNHGGSCPCPVLAGTPAPVSDTGPILDVAIGDGALTALTLRVGRIDPEIVGLDISADMLGRARRTLGGNPRFRSVLADARRLPFAGGTFRRVCCYGGLHVMAHPEEALAAMAAVLAPGGRFFASILLRPGGRFPAHLARRYVELGFLSSTFDEEEILELVRQAGLQPLEVVHNGRMLLLEAVRG
ncbi:MAG: class I SAM-dependent methyltransferase [Candidatus Riflebacteria bacterium]|nr:class I SAM-dependent methyltransferase [Candidatus Riflebacteria bacterium]